MGTSVAHAAMLNAPELREMPVDTTAGRPSPDSPMEERIKQAVDEVNQNGQAALEELGELDSTEKVARAEQILKEMERASHEIRKMAHHRVSERFDELNDIAVTRVSLAAQADLLELGNPNNAEKRQRAQEIRDRIRQQQEGLEEKWGQWREGLERRHQEQPLPQFRFQQPNGQPPDHAPAYGLRLRLEALSEAETKEAIAQLKRQSRTALERLGKLDTPGKIERARKIQARLEERTKRLRERVADQGQDQIDEQLEQQIQRLRLRAEAAVQELGDLETAEKQERAEAIRAKIEKQITQLRERLGRPTGETFNQQFEEQAEQLRQQAQSALEELGELDTPEKRELAHRIRARMQEELSQLREKVGDRDHSALEGPVDYQAQALRRRAQAALDALGELDTTEKQEMAQRIREQLDGQIRDLTRRLAHWTSDARDQEAEQIRQQAEVALRELGALDSTEKVEKAKQVRAKMEQSINQLKHRQAERLQEALSQQANLLSSQPSEAVANRANDDWRVGIQNQPGRTANMLTERQEEWQQLDHRVRGFQERPQGQAKQAIRQNVGASEVRTPMENHPAAGTSQPTPVPLEPPTTKEKRTVDRDSPAARRESTSKDGPDNSSRDSSSDISP
jgi:hypothetical protein